MPISTAINPMTGTLVGVNVLFVDETDVPTDPTTVTIQAIRPDGSLQSVVVSNLGVGIYHAEFIVDQPGGWTVQAKGTGALIVTEEASFKVRGRVIP